MNRPPASSLQRLRAAAPLLRLCLLRCLLLGSIAARPAVAAPPCPDRPLKVAMYESGYLSLNGKGIDHDLLDELGRRSGCRFERLVLPRARAQVWLKSGDIDIVMSTRATAERMRYAWFIPYLQLKWMAVLRADLTPEQSTREGFLADQTLHFGAVRGNFDGPAYAAWYATLERAGRLELIPNPETLFDLLKYRRVAGVFATSVQYEKALREHGLQDKVRLVDWFPSEPPVMLDLGLSMKAFSNADAAQWRTLLQQVKTDGTLERIALRYFPDKQAKIMIAK